MSFTNCCNHEFIGDNHSPIRPDGYCLHCGFHPEIESLKAEIGIYKANERIIQMRIDDLKEANKVLRGAVGGLIHHCRDYALTEESFVIAMEVDKTLECLAKADEIMGEKK